MRKALLLCLLCCTASVSAETVYIDDMLRVGIRALPNSSDAPIAVVTTGAPLEVLETSGNYIRVRTEDGTEGWINGTYASKELPAKQQLERLRKRYAELEEELAKAKADRQSALKSHDELAAKLGELSSANEALQEKLDSYLEREAEMEQDGDMRWLYSALAMISLFVFGVFLGILWYRQRLAQRLGGLEL